MWSSSLILYGYVIILNWLLPSMFPICVLHDSTNAPSPCFNLSQIRFDSSVELIMTYFVLIVWSCPVTGYSDWSYIITNYLPIVVKRDQHVRVCKIGDYDTESEHSWFRSHYRILRLWSTIKVEYKLISGPLYDGPDPLLKPWVSWHICLLLNNQLVHSHHHNTLRSHHSCSMDPSFDTYILDFPMSSHWL